MRCAALILLTGASLLAQNGSIEGTAVNASTGQPLPGVHVRLLTGLFEGGVKDVFGAISDKSGHFSITGMPPGAYILAPECTGYVYVPPKNEDSPIPAVQLKPGQRLQDYKLQMTPRAVLAGRVVDEFGDPVPNVQVQAVAASPNDQPINMFGNQFMGTNDRGEF